MMWLTLYIAASVAVGIAAGAYAATNHWGWDKADARLARAFFIGLLLWPLIIVAFIARKVFK